LAEFPKSEVFISIAGCINLLFAAVDALLYVIDSIKPKIDTHIIILLHLVAEYCADFPIKTVIQITKRTILAN
jgi:hypothetical protein